MDGAPAKMSVISFKCLNNELHEILRHQRGGEARIFASGLAPALRPAAPDLDLASRLDLCRSGFLPTAVRSRGTSGGGTSGGGTSGGSRGTSGDGPSGGCTSGGRGLASGLAPAFGSKPWRGCPRCRNVGRVILFQIQQLNMTLLFQFLSRTGFGK